MMLRRYYGDLDERRAFCKPVACYRIIGMHCGCRAPLSVEF